MAGQEGIYSSFSSSPSSSSDKTYDVGQDDSHLDVPFFLKLTGGIALGVVVGAAIGRTRSMDRQESLKSLPLEPLTDPKGEIIHLMQEHPSGTEPHDYFFDSGHGALPSILTSQLKVAQELKSLLEASRLAGNPPPLVFIEGLVEPMTQENLAFRFDRDRAKKIFPKGLPTDYTSLSEVQGRYLYIHCAPRILFFLGELDAVYPAESAELNDQASHLMEILPYDSPEVRDIVLCKREEYALSLIDKYLGESSGARAILVYGAAHDFSPVSRKWGFSLQKIACDDGCLGADTFFPARDSSSAEKNKKVPAPVSASERMPHGPSAPTTESLPKMTSSSGTSGSPEMEPGKKAKLLKLQQAQAPILMNWAETLYEELKTNKNSRSRAEYKKLKTELEGLARHFLELKQNKGLEITRWTDQQYCGGKIYEGNPWHPDVEIKFSPPKISTLDALREMWRGAKPIVQGFAPGVLGELSAHQAGKMAESFGLGKGGTYVAEILTAGVATGVSALFLGLGPVSSVSYAGFVIAAHVADALSFYESYLLNSNLPASSGRNASVFLGVGLGQVFNDVFGVLFGGMVRGAEGFVSGLFSRPTEFCWVPPAVSGLVQGVVSGTYDSLNSLVTHIAKVMSATTDVVPAVFREIGREALNIDGFSFKPNKPKISSPKTEDEPQDITEAPEPVKNFKFDDSGDSGESREPAPRTAWPSWNFSPAAPTPMQNFTSHLWMNAWQQQDPFSATLSSRSRPTPGLSSNSAYSAYSTYAWINQQVASTFSSRYGSSVGGAGSSRRGFQEMSDRRTVEKSFEESLRLGETYREAHFRAYSALGYPESFDYDQFVALLRSTGLVSSYKRVHPHARISRGGLLGEIGGVAAEVGKLEGFENSPIQKNRSPRFLLPHQGEPAPFSSKQLDQLLRELAQGIFVHDALPFFSLHFDQSHSADSAHSSLFPVIHPAYEKTSVGSVIAKIDFWMKGFLQGVIYLSDFLDQFGENPNFDEAYLKANWIDLKKYAHAHGIPYRSLREREFELGLESVGEKSNKVDRTDDPEVVSPLVGETAQGAKAPMAREGGSSYQQKFQTSFRILSHQKDAAWDQKNGLFLLSPFSFRVEYTIEPMPDYAETLRQYRAEHGKYPEEYEKLNALYREEARRIEKIMLQFPIFRSYFYQLDVLTFFSYYFHNLKLSGQKPVFEPMEKVSFSGCPKVFPTLPVRYYKRFEFKFSLDEILFPEGSPQMISSEYFDRDLRAILESLVKSKISASLREDNPHVVDALVAKLEPKVLENIDELDREVQEQYRQGLIEIIRENSLKGVRPIPTILSRQSLQEGVIGVEKALRNKLLDEIDQALRDARLKAKAENDALLKSRLAEIQQEAKEARESMTEKLTAHRDENLHTVNQEWEGLPLNIRAFPPNEQKYRQVLAQIQQEFLDRLAALEVQIKTNVETVTREWTSKIQEHSQRQQREFEEKKQELKSEILKTGSAQQEPVLKQLEQIKADLKSPGRLSLIARIAEPKADQDESILSPDKAEMDLKTRRSGRDIFEAIAFSFGVYLSTFELPSQAEVSKQKIVGGCGLDFYSQQLAPLSEEKSLVFQRAESLKGYINAQILLDPKPVMSALDYEDLLGVLVVRPLSASHQGKRI